MQVHAAAAANDGGTRLRIHAADEVQADERREFRADRLIRHADLERRPRNRLVDIEMPFAIETFLARLRAGLNAN